MWQRHTRSSGADVNRGRPCRGSFWLLIAAALLMRAVIPTGFMPIKPADGAIAVALCHSSGVLQIPLPKNEKPEKPGEHPACAYSVLLGGGAPPPAVAAFPGVFASAVAFAPAARSFANGAATRPKPPATGPPLPA